MSTYHGIDGCPAGWLCISWPANGNELPHAKIIPTLQGLTQRLNQNDIIAIDMPIGLPADARNSTNRRACDQAARNALGNRRTSVFFAPSRGILENLVSHSAASNWHRNTTGRGISQQCYHILHKVLQLDVWIQQNRGIARFFEVHPELSFAHWNGGQNQIPMPHKKSTHEGRVERRNKVEGSWPGAFDAAVVALGAKSSGLPNGMRKRLWANDDLLDAFSALWTARRIANRQAISYPPGNFPPTDSMGLPMRIMA